MYNFLEGGNFNKFTVIKNEDAKKYLTSIQIGVISLALGSIESGRKEEGKKLNQYLVINIDEPYAPEIVETLKKNGHWG